MTKILMVEIPFSNVLMIHQSIGRSLLRTQENPENSYHDLLTILGQFLPAAPTDACTSFVKKVLDQAISLKKAMMEEQALFRVYWVECDGEFDDHLVEVVDDYTNGKVMICTFPGLARFDKSDGEDTEHIVVKAHALLQNS